MIFQSEKTLGEIGDKVPESELTDVKAAIEKLKETIKNGLTEDIKADTDALEKAFYAVSEKLYAAQQNAQGGANGAGGDAGNGAQDGGAQNGDGTYYTNFEDNSNK